MPTYEYACTACGHHWDEIQKISADPLTDCPACAKAAAQRLISGGTFILKGGGWYSDLYSSTKPSSESSGTSAAPAATTTPSTAPAATAPSAAPAAASTPSTPPSKT